MRRINLLVRGLVVLSTVVALFLLGAYAHAEWSARGFSLTVMINKYLGQSNEGQSNEALGWQRYHAARVEYSDALGVAELRFMPADWTADSKTLDCLSDEDDDKVGSDPSHILSVFNNCQSELQRKLGAVSDHLIDRDLYAILATILAHRAAPYGDSGAVEFGSPKDLFSSQRLQCATYSALFGHLIHAAGLTDDQDISVFFVGFEGGYVGNHAQIFYSRSDVKLLLDPTIALIARLDFDTLLRGIKVPSSMIVDFYYWNETNLYEFRKKVAYAITAGLYRPRDLLYFYESFEHYVGLPDKPKYHLFLTPGRMIQRARPG